MLAVCVTLLPACAHRDAAVADAVGAATSTGMPYGGFALGEGADGGAIVLDVIAGPAAQPHNRLVPLLCENLVLDCSAIHLPLHAGASQSLAEFAESIAIANRRVREAFAAAGPRDRLFRGLRYLLEETATRRTLIDQPDSLRGIREMQASMHVDFTALLDAFNRLIADAAPVPDTSAPARRKIPAALAAMVEGEILDYAQVDGGYVVVGGPGPNRYRMDRLYAVIDTGGDDRYAWGEGVALETQTVIDLAGNDRYEARVGGPGAGWLGASVLIDMAGDDTYRCDAWSVGAGIYGAGVLIDAGDGWDSYLSRSLSQGVGGPAGVGFGIRPYDHGGIGALIDFGGNDRYEGGEFSQGGGYFWGVGLLHDAGGNDVYWSSGDSAQGVAGDNSYHFLDDDPVVSLGVLFDAGGDDRYSTGLANGEVRIRHAPGNPLKGRDNSGVAIDASP